jgi:FdhE protein
MKNAVNMDEVFWQDGRCPVCSAKPALSAIEKESQRKYFCSLCGTAGSYKRIGCPGCLTEDPQDITLITLEGEEGMRADTCEKCKSYVKTFESSMTEGHSMDSLDIMSIPLDIIVQEKGYKRHAPNPVGIMKIG